MGKEDANKPMSIVNDNMSDTPETDDQPVINAINDNGYQVPCVDIEFARKLEREREEAITRRIETIMQCELYEQERNEARKQNKKLRDIIQIAINIGVCKVGFPDWGFICEEFYKLKEDAK